MPATITLRDLSYATPDGTALFSHLDLVFGPQRTGLIGRNGVGKSTLVRLIAGSATPASGEILIDGRIGFLRQAVQVGDDETVADAMGIAPALQLLQAIESGTAELDDFEKADWTLPARLDATLASLGISDLTPDRPYGTLSGGQRTRVALAGLLLGQPYMIVLDEPTNNLDRDGRDAVAEMLVNWRGGAIVVSHDRELLGHMDAIVELTTLGARSYGGNWTAYEERKAVELAAAHQTLATSERRVVELDRRIQQQRERKARRDGAGARKAATGGIPASSSVAARRMPRTLQASLPAWLTGSDSRPPPS